MHPYRQNQKQTKYIQFPKTSIKRKIVFAFKLIPKSLTAGSVFGTIFGQVFTAYFLAGNHLLLRAMVYGITAFVTLNVSLAILGYLAFFEKAKLRNKRAIENELYDSPDGEFTCSKCQKGFCSMEHAINHIDYYHISNDTGESATVKHRRAKFINSA